MKKIVVRVTIFTIYCTLHLFEDNTSLGKKQQTQVSVKVLEFKIKISKRLKYVFWVYT